MRETRLLGAAALAAVCGVAGAAVNESAAGGRGRGWASAVRGVAELPEELSRGCRVDPVHAVVGTRVIRGPDWNWYDQDGGPGSEGVLTHRTGDCPGGSWWKVKWDAGQRNVYRVGCGGRHDLHLATCSSRPARSRASTCQFDDVFWPTAALPAHSNFGCRNGGTVRIGRSCGFERKGWVCDKVTCIGSSQWSTVTPACVLNEDAASRGCRFNDLKTPDGAVPSARLPGCSADGVVQPGGHCVFLSHGMACDVASCGENSRWAKTSPRCRAAAVPGASAPGRCRYSSVVPPSGATAEGAGCFLAGEVPAGSECRFFLKDHRCETVRCGADGKWSTEHPTCTTSGCRFTDLVLPRDVAARGAGCVGGGIAGPGAVCSLSLSVHVDGATRRDCGVAVCALSGGWHVDADRCKHAAAGSLEEAAAARILSDIAAGFEAEQCLRDADVRPGMPVVRGPDWRWGKQDGGAGQTGVVLEQEEACPGGHWWRVVWAASGKVNNYRVGCSGKSDICPMRSSAPVGRGGGGRGRGGRGSNRCGRGACGTAPAPESRFKCTQETACEGLTIARLTAVTSVDRCSDMCALLNECAAAEWMARSGGVCMLKAAGCSPRPSIRSTTCLRGGRHTEGAPSELPSAEDWVCERAGAGGDKDGVDIFTLSGVLSPKECAVHCGTVPDCVAMQHVNRTCMLLSTPTSGRAIGGTICARKQPSKSTAAAMAAAATSYQCGRNRRFEGGSLFKFSDVADRTACQGYCDRVPECVAVEHDGSNCALKAFLTAPVPTPPGLNISACVRVSSAASEQSDYDCAATKRHTGFSLLSFSGIRDQTKCNALCSGVSECTGTTFLPGGGCELMRGSAVLAEPTGMTVDGVVVCIHTLRAAQAATPAPAPQEVVVDSRRAHAQSTTTNMTVEEESIYYAQSQWVRNELPDGRVLYVDNGLGAVSSTRPAGYGYDCVRDSNFVGGDLFRLVDVPRVSECEQVCNDVAKCVGFVHRGACPKSMKTGGQVTTPDRAKCHTCDIKLEIQGEPVKDAVWRLSTACVRTELPDTVPNGTAWSGDCTNDTALKDDDLVATQYNVMSLAACENLCPNMGTCVAIVYRGTVCRMYQSAEETVAEQGSTLCVSSDLNTPSRAATDLSVTVYLPMTESEFEAVQADFSAKVVAWVSEHLPPGEQQPTLNISYEEVAADSRRPRGLSASLSLRRAGLLTATHLHRAAARAAVRAGRLHRPRRYACGAGGLKGGDIRAVAGVGSADECLQICTQTDDCTAVVYGKGACRLKSSAATASPGAKGDLACEWEGPQREGDAGAAEYECASNASYAGGDLFAVSGMDSEDSCRALCQAAGTDCGMYVYRHSAGLCELKVAGEAVAVDDEAAAGRACTVTTRSPGYNCEVGTLVGGTLFDVNQVSTARECARLCASVPRCRATVFVGGSCSLKSAEAAPGAADDSSVVCRPPAADQEEEGSVGDGYQCDTHWAYEGAQLVVLENVTVTDDCFAACSRLADCAAVVFRSARCHLHSSSAQSVPEAKAVACARKRADDSASAKSPFSCVVGGMVEGGDLLQIQDVTLATDCQAHCTAIPECAVAVLQGTTCYLKSGMPARKTEAVAAHRSATICTKRVETPAPTERHADDMTWVCGEHGSDGADLYLLEGIGTMRECAQQCDRVPSCGRFAFTKATGTCVLKNATGGPVTHDSNTVTCLRAPRPQGAANLPKCACQVEWTAPEDGGQCSGIQHGCPAAPCDSSGRRWCMVAAGGCATEEHGSWTYCTDATEVGVKTAAAAPRRSGKALFHESAPEPEWASFTATITKDSDGDAGLAVDVFGVVTQVRLGGPADAAGIRANMRITSVGGTASPPSSVAEIIESMTGNFSVGVEEQVCPKDKIWYFEFEHQLKVPKLTLPVFTGTAYPDSEVDSDGRLRLRTRVKALLQSNLAPTDENWRAVSAAAAAEMAKADGLFAKQMDPVLEMLGLPPVQADTIESLDSGEAFQSRFKKAKLHIRLQFAGLVGEVDNGQCVAQDLANLLSVEDPKVQIQRLSKCRVSGQSGLPDSCNDLFKCNSGGVVAGCLNEDGVSIENRKEQESRGVLFPGLPPQGDGDGDSVGSTARTGRTLLSFQADVGSRHDQRGSFGAYHSEGLAGGHGKESAASTTAQAGGHHDRLSASDSDQETQSRPGDRDSNGPGEGDVSTRPQGRDSVSVSDVSQPHDPQPNDTDTRPCYTVWEGTVLLSPEQAADKETRMEELQQFAQEAHQKLLWFVQKNQGNSDPSVGGSAGYKPFDKTSSEHFDMLKKADVTLVLEKCDKCVDDPVNTTTGPGPDMPPADATSASVGRRLLQVRDDLDKRVKASVLRRVDRIRAVEKHGGRQRAGRSLSSDGACTIGPQGIEYGLMSDKHNVDPSLLPPQFVARWGRDVAPMTGVTMQDCSDACNSIPDLCVGFSREHLGIRDDVKLSCYLKRAVLPYVGDQFAFSGWGTCITRCPQPDNPCQWQAMDNVALHVVEEFRTAMPVVNEDHCKALCESLHECQGASYHKVSRVCYFVHEDEGGSAGHDEFTSFLCSRSRDPGQVLPNAVLPSQDLTCTGAGALCYADDSTTCTQLSDSYRCGCKAEFECIGCVDPTPGCSCDTDTAPKVCAPKSGAAAAVDCGPVGQPGFCIAGPGSKCFGVAAAPGRSATPAVATWRCGCANGYHCTGNCGWPQLPHQCAVDTCLDQMLGSVAQDLRELLQRWRAEGNPELQLLDDAVKAVDKHCKPCSVFMLHLGQINASALPESEGSVVGNATAMCATVHTRTLLEAWMSAWTSTLEQVIDPARTCTIPRDPVEVCDADSAPQIASPGNVPASVAYVPVERRKAHQLTVRVRHAPLSAFQEGGSEGLSGQGVQRIREEVADAVGVAAEDVTTGRLCAFLAASETPQVCFDDKGNPLSVAAQVSSSFDKIEQVVVCEKPAGRVWGKGGPARERHRVQCPDGQAVRVHNAFFGRRTCHSNLCYGSSGYNCGRAADGTVLADGACDSTGHCSCSAPRATLALRRHCDGRQSCQFVANTAIFGDPCPGENKYLWVNYSCADPLYSDADDGSAGLAVCARRGGCEIGVTVSVQVPTVDVMRVVTLPSGKALTLAPGDDLPDATQVIERVGHVVGDRDLEAALSNEVLRGAMRGVGARSVSEGIVRAVRSRPISWPDVTGVDGVELVDVCHDSIKEPGVVCSGVYCRIEDSAGDSETSTSCTGVPACRASYCHDHGAPAGFQGACSCECRVGFAGARCSTCAAGYVGYPRCRNPSAPPSPPAAEATAKPQQVERERQPARPRHDPVAAATTHVTPDSHVSPSTTVLYHSVSVLPPEHLHGARGGLNRAFWDVVGRVAGVRAVRALHACPLAACDHAGCPHRPVGAWPVPLRAQCASLAAAPAAHAMAGYDFAVPQLSGGSLVEFEVTVAGDVSQSVMQAIQEARLSSSPLTSAFAVGDPLEVGAQGGDGRGKSDSGHSTLTLALFAAGFCLCGVGAFAAASRTPRRKAPPAAFATRERAHARKQWRTASTEPDVWVSGSHGECVGPYAVQRATINDRPVWGMMPDSGMLLYSAKDGRWCIADRGARILDGVGGAAAWTLSPASMPWAPEAGGWVCRRPDSSVTVTRTAPPAPPGRAARHRWPSGR